jgi:peptide/nickel transport system ATP-binding protein
MLDIVDLAVRFARVTVVSGFDLSVPDGPYGVGLVGESGSGKTTIARAAMGLVRATHGRIMFEGEDVRGMGRRQLRSYRRAVQIVLQDPDGTLDPRLRVGNAIAEVLKAHNIVGRGDIETRVAALLVEAGLTAAHGGMLPHQLSGGERQRVSIARALAVEPRLLILDEPTSAVDAPVQVQILELLRRLRAERGLAYLLISHNLVVVERLCESIAVIYLGRIVERGASSRVFGEPAHPYTAALRSAVPQIVAASGRPNRILLPGAPPDPARPPSGCVFHPRCPIAIERCRLEVPKLIDIAPDRQVACHRADEVLEGTVDLRPVARR